MKTPEEIDRLELLAASYACDYRDSPNKTNGIPDSYLVYSIAYDAFLDGYKAAMDQVADADKVMPQWISVKERLPPDGAKVLLIVFGDIHYGWIDQSPSDPTEYCLYFSNKYIDKGHYALTHWMPIPRKPKYMSDYVEYERPKEEK